MFESRRKGFGDVCWQREEVELCVGNWREDKEDARGVWMFVKVGGCVCPLSRCLKARGVPSRGV